MMVEEKSTSAPFVYCDGCDGYNCDDEKGCAYPGVAQARNAAAVLKVSSEGFDRFLDAIKTPPAPNEKLVALMRSRTPSNSKELVERVARVIAMKSEGWTKNNKDFISHAQAAIAEVITFLSVSSPAMDAAGAIYLRGNPSDASGCWETMLAASSLPGRTAK